MATDTGTQPSAEKPPEGIFLPLEDFKTQDLPERKFSFWKMIGPGAVMVGLAIGAGEIVIWPYLITKYGAAIAWAAAVGVFLQIWINFEVGRWTIATGETTFTGYSRVWRGFGPVFILLTIMGWLAPGWARTSGLTLKALITGPTHDSSDTFWTIVTFAIVALLLFGPKVAYKAVEKTIEILIIIVTIGMVVVAIGVGTTVAWKELFSGVVNIGYIPEDISIKDFFSALVFAGAGGTSNLFYSFYLRDKHIGMGAHLPSMQNPLRGEAEKIPATGFKYPDTPENALRFKSWWNYIRLDTVCIFWLMNTVTIMLFIFGAVAVLRPNGIGMNKGSLIYDEAMVLGQVWGAPGRILFLCVGVATLFSTQLAVVDGVARSMADILYTNFSFARRKSVGWWYAVVAATWIVVGITITYVLEQRQVSELGFLFNAAYMGGFAMAIYCPLQLYINHKHLPQSARPGKLCTVMMIVVSLVYISFAVASLKWEFSG